MEQAPSKTNKNAQNFRFFFLVDLRLLDAGMCYFDGFLVVVVILGGARTAHLDRFERFVFRLEQSVLVVANRDALSKERVTR